MKSQALPIHTIILSAVGVMVLLISAVTFSGQIGKSNQQLDKTTITFSSCSEAANVLHGYKNVLNIEDITQDYPECEKIVKAFEYICKHNCKTFTDTYEVKKELKVIIAGSELHPFSCSDVNTLLGYCKYNKEGVKEINLHTGKVIIKSGISYKVS